VQYSIFRWCSPDQVSVVSRRFIDERTLVYFADNSLHVLKAYADSQEGLDRAGGFAVQVCSRARVKNDIHAVTGSRKLTHSQD
jgi:predicted house-cleaning NTP pyrophosphatase (Maf/HAM1 superfamily)